MTTTPNAAIEAAANALNKDRHWNYPYACELAKLALTAALPHLSAPAAGLSEEELRQEALTYLTRVGWGGEGNIAAVMAKFARTIIDRLAASPAASAEMTEEDCHALNALNEIGQGLKSIATGYHAEEQTELSTAMAAEASKLVPVADATLDYLTRKLAPPASRRGETAVDLRGKIGAEIYRAIEVLGGSADLLACIGSYGDTLSDADVLSALELYNKTGKALIEKRDTQ